MEIRDAIKLKALEEENRKLKRLVADLILADQELKHLLGKKFEHPKTRERPLSGLFLVFDSATGSAVSF